jgi:hypothetical protein
MEISGRSFNMEDGFAQSPSKSAIEQEGWRSEVGG